MAVERKRTKFRLSSTGEHMGDYRGEIDISINVVPQSVALKRPVRCNGAMEARPTRLPGGGAVVPVVACMSPFFLPVLPLRSRPLTLPLLSFAVTTTKPRSSQVGFKRDEPNDDPYIPEPVRKKGGVFGGALCNICGKYTKWIFLVLILVIIIVVVVVVVTQTGSPAADATAADGAAAAAAPAARRLLLDSSPSAGFDRLVDLFRRRR